MAYEVAISPQAGQELEEVWSFIAQDSPDEADRFVARLVAEARSLITLPRRGRNARRRRNIWDLVFESNWIVYRINETKTRIEILRFWHSARDITRLRL